MSELNILRELRLKDLTDDDASLVDELYLQLSTTCSCCHGVDKLASEKIDDLRSRYFKRKINETR